MVFAGWKEYLIAAKLKFGSNSSGYLRAMDAIFFSLSACDTDIMVVRRAWSSHPVELMWHHVVTSQFLRRLYPFLLVSLCLYGCIFVQPNSLCGKVLNLLFFFCPVINNSATVAPIDVTFCIMVHIGPGHVFSPFEAVLPGDPLSPKFCA